MNFTCCHNIAVRVETYTRSMSVLVMFLFVSCSTSQQQQHGLQQGDTGAKSQNANSQNAARNQQNSANANTNFTNQNDRKNNNGSKNYTAGINNAVEPVSNVPVESVTNVATNTLAPVNTPLNTTINTTASLNQTPVNGVGNLANAPTNAPPVNTAPPQNAAVQAPTGAKVIDLGPPHGLIQWVGYNYRKEQRKLDVQIVTEGRPIYKIFQDVNRAKQPEIVIRFLNTEIRHKVRRDLDASEFRSPVAFVRMRRDNIFRHSDVILTLRDKIQPKMLAKGSSIMLTFDIPDRWYGPKGEAEAPIAKVDIAPDANVMPVVDPASEPQLPTAKTLVRAYVDDPGKDEFKEMTPEQAVPLVPSENTPELIPAGTTPVAANPEMVQPASATQPTDLVPQNISTPQKAPVAKPVRQAQLNVAPVAEAKPLRQQQQVAPPGFVPQQAVPMAPPPSMIVPPQPMMVPQSVPVPVGVPGVVPQQYPGQPATQPAVPPAEPKDGTGKGADKFEVRTHFLEEHFSVAGVAQASPMMDAAPITVEGSSDLQGSDPSVGGGAQTEAPKKLLKFDFRSATVGTVLRVISNESGLNFVMPPEVAAKKMSVSLNNVPWDVALKAVLEANRLGMEEVGPKIIRVDTLKTFVEDRDTQERAKQATALLVPTKVLVMRLSYALAEKIAPIVQDLFPKPSDTNIAQMRNYTRFKVKADTRSNSIVVEATPMELQKVKALVERLDLATPQVRISSRIVEVIAKAENALGVSWGSPFNIDGGRGLGFGSLPFPNNLTSNFAVDPSFSGNPVGAASMKFGSINNVMALDLKIKMLETRSEAESLQSQDLMVEDNQEAKIDAGAIDYFSEPAQGLQGPTLTPVTYSTSLSVVPHITADGAVQMNLKITGDIPTKTNPDAKAGKLTRNLNTTMMRRSGDTAVIGGLYTTDKTKVTTGVPFLSRLPIIGALFRGTSAVDNRRDLLIMVTPTIVNTALGNLEPDPNAGIPSGPLSAGASGIALPPLRPHGQVETGEIETRTTPASGEDAKEQGYPRPDNNAVPAVGTSSAAAPQNAVKQQGNAVEDVTPVSEESDLD